MVELLGLKKLHLRHLPLLRVSLWVHLWVALTVRLLLIRPSFQASWTRKTVLRWLLVAHRMALRLETQQVVPLMELQLGF